MLVKAAIPIPHLDHVGDVGHVAVLVHGQEGVEQRDVQVTRAKTSRLLSASRYRGTEFIDKYR